MATVRLFARLRELAGSSRVQIDGETVGQVVEAAGAQFGAEFAASLETARVWLNGEQAEWEQPVSEGDEVAILPPVSGGASMTASTVQVSSFIPAVAAVVLFLIHLQGDAPLWAAGLVAMAGAWAIDIATRMELRGRSFPAVAVVVGAMAGAVISAAMGPAGMAIAIAGAVAVVLAWGVAIAGYRSVDTVAPGVMVGILAAAAVASLVLARSDASPDAAAVDVFLIVVIVATAAGSLVDRLSQLPYLDPFSVTAITAIVAAIGVAFIQDLDVAGYLLVGLGLAVTLVAGRGLGGMLRTGAVSLTERAPGFLASSDGAVLAAALYFPLIRLVL